MNDTWGNPQVLHGTLQWKNRTYARAESGFLFCIENEKIIWRQLVSRWYRHLSVQELPDGRQVLVLQSTPGDQVYAGSALKSEARDLATGDRVDVRGSGVIAKAPKLESHWAVIATGAGVAVCENDKQFQNAIKKFAKGMSRGGMWPDFKKSNVLFYSTKIEPSRQLRVLGGSVDDRRNIVRVTRRLDRIENSVRQKKHDFEFCWVTIPKSAKPIVIQEEVSVVDGMPQWKNLHTLIRDDDGSWSEPAFASPRSASDSQSTPNTAMSRAQQPLSAETKDKRKTTLDMYHGGTQKMLETLMTSYRPMQSDAVYAVVRSLDGVNLEVKKSVRGAGGYYAVTGANGHPLRRFSDTNGDMQADRFVYYKDGKKSYEELDTNHDHKIDKFLYYAKDGSITKTLVDKNGDGVADEESAASN